MATRIEISNGPSKHDLQLALFEGKQVVFKTVGKFGNPSTLFRVYIEGLDGADHSAEKWYMKGTLLTEASCNPSVSFKTALKVVGFRWCPHKEFHGYYETQKRQGWIEF